MDKRMNGRCNTLRPDEKCLMCSKQLTGS